MGLLVAGMRTEQVVPPQPGPYPVLFSEVSLPVDACWIWSPASGWGPTSLEETQSDGPFACITPAPVVSCSQENVEWSAWWGRKMVLGELMARAESRWQVATKEVPWGPRLGGDMPIQGCQRILEDRTYPCPAYPCLVFVGPKRLAVFKVTVLRDSI